MARPPKKKKKAEPADPLVLLRNPMTPKVDAEGRAIQISPYRPMENPCRICPARCCHPLVHVSLPEALRLVAALELPFLEAIALVPDAEDGRAIELLPDPRITTYLTPFTGRAALVLRRKEAGGCIFLTELGGFLRCGVYGLRPSACRIYPLSWEKGNLQGGPQSVLCPVPYAVKPGSEELLDQVVSGALADWAIHRRILSAFDQEAGPRTLDRFLDFAIPLAAEAAGVSQAIAIRRAGAAELFTEALLAARK